jgi:hypothetical protein
MHFSGSVRAAPDWQEMGHRRRRDRLLRVRSRHDRNARCPAWSPLFQDRLGEVFGLPACPYMSGRFPRFVEHQIDFGEREPGNLHIKVQIDESLQFDPSRHSGRACCRRGRKALRWAASRWDRRTAGTLCRPMSLAASTLPCPAMISSSSPIRTGFVKPPDAVGDERGAPDRVPDAQQQAATKSSRRAA